MVVDEKQEHAMSSGAAPEGAAQQDPPVLVSQLSVIGFQSGDVDRLVEYYQEALCLVLTERTDGAAYLTTGPEHHCVAITRGEPKARSFLGLRIAGSLDEAERRLRLAGIQAERQTDPQPGITEALTIADPAGTPLMLFESQTMTGAAPAAGVRPVALGHVASFSADIEQDQRFYVEILGFRWSDSIDDWFTFLRCGADHHSVNFLRQPPHSGMHHVAYKMRDIVHLKDTLDHLAGLGYRLQWGPGRHGPGHNIFSYHQDPDGNTVELFTELDVVIDERTGQFEP
ncbi:MAG: VOC family protein, partial [Gammaproteobacteria bacterium]|nr:VOC family protein [Gammaproteobacteria bacterium]